MGSSHTNHHEMVTTYPKLLAFLLRADLVVFIIIHNHHQEVKPGANKK